MGLNSDQLDAFFEVARLKSFSRAAEMLAISQPALSQRVRKLEEELKATLFVRESTGTTLTAMGQRLLLYCRTRRDLEAEFLQSPQLNRVSGIIRIAGFSSIVRSAIVPALNDLMIGSPHLQLEILTRELHELPDLLKSAETDFVVTDKPISSDTVESTLIGVEENILIESPLSKGKIPDVYFDHDLDDQTTFEFFKKQGKRELKKIRRSFLDEIYAIVEAVERGWGRAVVPQHLIAGNKRVRKVAGYSIVKTDVYLNYHLQPFYLPLHKAITAALTGKIGLILKSSTLQ